MHYKVSILIPIYNAATVVERCLQSVFCQTLDDIEYILINDCSTDDSLSVCRRLIDAYPSRSPHVTLIDNAENQGISRVRNQLVSQAHADYIYFVDSDDWLEPDAAEVMYAKAVATQADVVASSYFINTLDSEQPQTVSYPAEKTACLNAFLRMTIKPVIWLFIFRRTLFAQHQIAFPPRVNVLEDYYAGSVLLLHANGVAGVDRPLYHYRIGHNFYSVRPQLYFASAQEAIRLTDDYFRSHADYADYEASLTLRKIIFKSKFLFERLQFDDRRYRQTFPEANGAWRRFRVFSRRQRLLLQLAECRYCHPLFLLLRKTAQLLGS